MFIRTKIVLAGALLFGLTSIASAQPGFDSNLANRYPHYADPGVYGYTGNANAPVLLHSERDAALQLHQIQRGRVRQERW